MLALLIVKIHEYLVKCRLCWLNAVNLTLSWYEHGALVERQAVKSKLALGS